VGHSLEKDKVGETKGVSPSMRVVDSNQKATHLERLELVKRLKSSNNCVIKSNLSDKYAMQKSD
jgi:hypothetical protein